jgi:hypothetical protein
VTDRVDFLDGERVSAPLPIQYLPKSAGNKEPPAR